MSPLNKPIAAPADQLAAASKRRAAVAAVVFGAGARGMTVTEVVEATQMPRHTISKILARLRATEALVSVSQANTLAMRLYAPGLAPAEPAETAAPRTFTHLSRVETYTTEGLKPVRAGAENHLAVPSRRGDQRVQHQPMMCMGSSVSGGL